MRKLKTNRAVSWVTNEDVFWAVDDAVSGAVGDAGPWAMNKAVSGAVNWAVDDAVRVNLPHPALADFLPMVGEPDGQPEDELGPAPGRERSRALGRA